MSIDLSQKKPILAIIGVVIAVIVLALIATRYGSLIKTSADIPTQDVLTSGSVQTDTLEPDTYTLQFTGSNGTTSVDASTTFQVTAPALTATPTPEAAVITSTPTPETAIETPTPIVETSTPTPTPILEATATPVATLSVSP